MRKASSFGCSTFTIIDEYSNPVGDILLEEVSKAINRTIRNSDFAGRYGGEEFAIVMSNTGFEEAAEIAERMRKSIKEYKFNTKKILTTVSIGIALYPLDANSLQDLLKKADSALYQAKHNGKNQVCAYSNTSKPY